METVPEAAADRPRPVPGKAGRRDPAAFYWHPCDASASLPTPLPGSKLLLSVSHWAATEFGVPEVGGFEHASRQQPIAGPAGHGMPS